MLTLIRCSVAFDKRTIMLNFSSSKTLFSISKISNNILIFTMLRKWKTVESSLWNKYEPNPFRNLVGILHHSTQLFTNR